MKSSVRSAISLAVIASLVAPTAGAWDSKCSVYQDPSEPTANLVFVRDCGEGPEATQQRLRQPDSLSLDEHRRIFSYGAALVGLPEEALETQQLRVYTANTAASGTALPSMQPVAFAMADRARTRSFAPDEFAMLPDFSFSLFDWASGNETCPVRGYTSDGGVECHAFKGHMGASNANHFPPQSGEWYRRLHWMALERARSCAAVRARVAMASPGADRRFTSFWRECEAEALSLEALAQHYMQDNWSAGHSWERWGSSDLDRFSPTFDPLISGMFPPAQMRIVHGLVVGALSGMIHGMEPSYPSLPDALCFPHDDIYLGRSGTRFRAGGDDHLRDLLTGIPALSTQRDKMLACSAAGVREVYRELGPTPAFGAFTAPRPVPGGVSVAIPASSTDPECEPYRATNRAFSHGIGIDFAFLGGTFVPLEVFLATYHLAANIVLPRALTLISNVATAQLTFDATRLALNARLASRIDPDMTYMSSLQGTGEGAYTMLGVHPNRQYAAPAMGPGMLASYQDPALPWPATMDTTTPDAAPRAQALARTFHRAHAADWCAQTTMADLTALRARASTSEDTCEVCVEVASRHLRVGTSTDYDHRAEPFCQLATGAGPVIYQPVFGAVTQPRALARHWCGCRRGVLSVSDQIRQLAFTGGPMLTETSGPRFPVSTLPRDIATSSDLRAIVTHNDGTLVYADLANERELDTDHNAMTTSAGAPAGVTRLSAGSSARGVAIVERNATTYALVLVPGADEMAVFDIGSRHNPRSRLCERFNIGRDAARNEDAWDIVVMPSGLDAYVSFRGAGTQLSNALAIINVPNATDCTVRGDEVTRHIAGPIGGAGPFGGAAGLSSLSLSPNAAKLLIGIRRAAFCTATVRDASNMGTISMSVGCDNFGVFDTNTNALDTLSIGPLRTIPASSPQAGAWFSAGTRVAFGSFAGPDLWPQSAPLGMPATVRLGDATSGALTYGAAVFGQLLGETIVIDPTDRYVFVATSAGGIYALNGLAAGGGGWDDFWTMFDADPENALHGLPSWYGGCRNMNPRCVGGYCPTPCTSPVAFTVGAGVRILSAF